MKARLVASCVCVLLAAPAGATVMETWTRFSLQFTNLGRAEASDVEVGVSTVTSTAGGQLQALTLSANPGLSLNTVIPVTDPIVTVGGIASVRLTSVRARPDLQGGVFGNVPVALASGGPLSPRTLAKTGGLRVATLGTRDTDLDVGATSGGMQVGIGVGGVLTFGAALGYWKLSVVGAPYTVQTVTNFNRTIGKALTPVKEHGFAHGPASATATTALTSGVIQFVTANQSRSDPFLVGNISDRWGSFTRLLIHFAPEPGLGVTLGVGALAVAWLGRRRQR